MLSCLQLLESPHRASSLILRILQDLLTRNSASLDMTAASRRALSFWSSIFLGHHIVFLTFLRSVSRDRSCRTGEFPQPVTSGKGFHFVRTRSKLSTRSGRSAKDHMERFCWIYRVTLIPLLCPCLSGNPLVRTLPHCLSDAKSYYQRYCRNIDDEHRDQRRQIDPYFVAEQAGIGRAPAR